MHGTLAGMRIAVMLIVVTVVGAQTPAALDDRPAFAVASVKPSSAPATSRQLRRTVTKSTPSSGSCFEPRQAPVDVFVIESAEQPTEN